MDLDGESGVAVSHDCQFRPQSVEAVPDVDSPDRNFVSRLQNVLLGHRGEQSTEKFVEPGNCWVLV